MWQPPTSLPPHHLRNHLREGWCGILPRVEACDVNREVTNMEDMHFDFIPTQRDILLQDIWYCYGNPLLQVGFFGTCG